MMIHFYHLPHNFQNLSFKTSFTCHRILEAIPPTILVKVVSYAVLGNTSQYQLCVGTLMPPIWDFKLPVELLKIAPAPMQSKKADLSFTGRGGTV